MQKANPNYLKNTQIEKRFNNFPVWWLVLWMQWGDEWKWKITDALVQAADVVVRFNWWHNAGHSVKVWNNEYALHILPSWVVSDSKENLILSSCVLGIKLNKINLDLFEKTSSWIICNYSLKDLILKDNLWKPKEVWLIPELEKLQSWGINLKNVWLKISINIPLIWIYWVLLDAIEEVSRKFAGLLPIGSTGSWISPAYTFERRRLHLTLASMLENPEYFYWSIKSIFNQIWHIFPKISVDEIIKKTKQEEQLIRKYIEKWIIEIIEDERDYIQKLVKQNKKIIWEWAQSVMIWEKNSYYWTSSTPSLKTFLEVTWLKVNQIWNVFWVHKMPPSSVWIRPGFMKFPETKALDNFRQKYKEFWVSSWRPRDLFYHSLVETAWATKIWLEWLDDENKYVPVFNRVDALKDSLWLYDDNKLKIIKWYTYKITNYLDWKQKEVYVWIKDEKIFPQNVRKNYPTKARQLNLFNINWKNLEFLDIWWEYLDIQINNLLKLHLASIFSKDEPKEYIIWIWPDRDDLKLQIDTPLRKI